MLDLQELQTRIHKDPDSYRTDYEQQLAALDAHLDILRLQTQSEHRYLCSLIAFLSQSAGHYRDDLAKELPVKVLDLLKTIPHIHPQVRLALVRGLFSMRAKRLVAADPLQITLLVVPFLALPDKILRATIESFFVRDLRSIFRKKDKQARAIQQAILNPLDACTRDFSSYNAVFYRSIVDICIRLFKLGLFDDPKTINSLINACHCPYSKASGACLSFFLAGEVTEEESDDEDDKPKEKSFVKKTKHRLRAHERAMEKFEQKERKRQDAAPVLHYNQKAIDLIYSPVDAGRRLVVLSREKSVDFAPRHRLMCLQVASLIGRRHLVDIPGFFSCIINYIQPSLEDVTIALSAASQAVHTGTAPDAVTPVVKAVCDRFITDRNRPEHIAIGLTTVRELVVRCPYAVEPDLLADLVGYISYKDKGVVMAARSILQCYREEAPELLPRKLRGRPPKKERRAGEEEEEEGDYSEVESEIDLDSDDWESGDGSDSSDDSDSDCDSIDEELSELPQTVESSDSEEELINDPSVFEAPPLKKKRTKEDRVATMQGGRDKKYIAKAAIRSMKKGGGTTNKTKQKKKSFLMVRNSSSKRKQRLQETASKRRQKPRK
ncbi:hypothetical protein RCL1_002931 [Eukaryota sp. TZLM3-RCL]